MVGKLSGRVLITRVTVKTQYWRSSVGFDRVENTTLVFAVRQVCEKYPGNGKDE